MIIDRPELKETADPVLPDVADDVTGADKPQGSAAADDASISSKPHHLQHQRKRNLSISFAFHALSRNLRGGKDRDSGRWPAGIKTQFNFETNLIKYSFEFSCNYLDSSYEKNGGCHHLEGGEFQVGLALSSRSFTRIQD